MLDPVAQLGQHGVGDVVGQLGHEEHADALGPDEPHGLGDLVEELLRRALEEQVRLVEEEHQLGLREVAGLGQLVEQLGEEPHEERGEQAGLVLDGRQLEDVDDALAVGGRPDEVVDRQLGLAEERLGALLVELDDVAQQHPGGGGRQAADALQRRLALVAREVLEDGPEVVEVEQRQALLVGVVEDERQRRRLRLVGVEHLGEQLRAETRGGGADGDPRTQSSQGPEGHRLAGRGPLDAQLRHPGRDLVVGGARLQQPGQVALDVGGEHGHAEVRQLLGEQLERLGLAGARRPGDQAVAVHHGGGDLDDGARLHGAADHPAPEAHGRPARGVGLGDPGGELGGVGRHGRSVATGPPAGRVGRRERLRSDPSGKLTPCQTRRSRFPGSSRSMTTSSSRPTCGPTASRKKYLDRAPRVERDRPPCASRAGALVREGRCPTARWCDWWIYDDVQSTRSRGCRRPSASTSLDNAPVTFDEIRPGCWKQKERLEDMDANHVEASICFPNVLPRFCGQTFLERAATRSSRCCACRPTTTG